MAASGREVFRQAEHGMANSQNARGWPVKTTRSVTAPSGTTFKTLRPVEGVTISRQSPEEPL